MTDTRKTPTVRPAPADVALDADAVDRRAGELYVQAEQLIAHARVLQRTAALMRLQICWQSATPARTAPRAN
jgi:hypothetical protein